MTFKTIKLRWAKKLMRARYFVVLTDKESVIAIDGADPNTFTDLLSLSSQEAEIQMFHDKLGSLIKDHKRAVDKLTLTRVNNAKKARRPIAEPVRRVRTVVGRPEAKKAKN